MEDTDTTALVLGCDHTPPTYAAPSETGHNNDVQVENTFK